MSTTTSSAGAEKKTNSKEVKASKKYKVPTEAELKLRRPELLREPLIDKELAAQGLPPIAKESLADKAHRLDAHFRNVLPVDKIAKCTCGYWSDPASSPARCPFCGDEEITPRDEEIFKVAAEKGALAKAPPLTIDTTAEDVTPAEDRNASAEKLAQLDAAVVKVAAAHRQSVGTYWDLGDALRLIHERQLYFQRLDEKGAPRYRSFTQFLAEEFGGQIAPGHAYRVMDVAKKFDRPTAVEIGVAKLSLLVRAKDEALPKLLEAAKTQTVKELAKTAAPDLHQPGSRPSAPEAEQRKGKGSAVGSKEARSSGRVMATMRAEARENAVTVSTTLGAVEIPLFCGADTKRRAKKLSDEPVGEEVYINGVAARFRVAPGADGGLVLKIVRTRATA